MSQSFSSVRHAVFDQNDISSMRLALEDAWNALPANERSPARGGADIRLELARLIVQHATSGERNPAVLTSGALRRFRPIQAYQARLDRQSMDRGRGWAAAG